MTGKPSGQILATGSRRVMIRDEKGKVLWQHKGENVSDCWMLKDGNILVGQINHITEFNTKGKIVWQFSSDDVQGLKINSMCGIHVQANGNLAVGVYSAYNGGGQVGLFEITREKKIVWK